MCRVPWGGMTNACWLCPGNVTTLSESASDLFCISKQPMRQLMFYALCWPIYPSVVTSLSRRSPPTEGTPQAPSWKVETGSFSSTLQTIRITSRLCIDQIKTSSQKKAFCNSGMLITFIALFQCIWLKWRKKSRGKTRPAIKEWEWRKPLLIRQPPPSLHWLSILKRARALWKKQQDSRCRRAIKPINSRLSSSGYF